MVDNVMKNMEIALRIKAILQEKGMTQRDLAEAMSKKESEISRWLSGKNGFSKATIEKLNIALGESLLSATMQKEQKDSMQNSRSYAIILAGGIGSRVGADVPKQFVEILGKPVLAYTIEAYQNHPEIDGIEVVCVKNYEENLKELIKKYKLNKVRWICPGGATFQDSVYNGVENLKGQIEGNDIVMVHYGAAPFTSAEIISDAIKVCRRYGNSVSVTPCYQLLGSNDPNAESKHWVDRDKYVQLACPQSFQYKYICDIYEEAIEKNLLSKVEPHTTSLLYLMGKTLYQSYGDQTNIKITTKEDLDMFEGYVLMELYREGKVKVKV